MRNLLVTFFTLMSLCSFAQTKGTLKGNLQDQDMDLEPLPFVSVYDSKNNTVGTTSDFDGNFTLKLTPGVHTIIFEFVGYKTVKKQVTVKSGATQNITVVMASVADALDAVVLTAVVNKESEEALVEAQKEAVEIVTAIGAEEMSKKGVGNVAAAVTKAAGVTKEEGGSGSVFVRGLGDRYNVTTLNGLPLPSNNPSNKNISLDIFSTDIVQFVGISKTFEAKNYADFGGANIDVNSKKFSGKPFLSVGIGAGTNSNIIGVGDFYQQDGPNYFGFNTIEVPNNPTTPNNYTTSWDRKNVNYLLNNSISLSGGKGFDIGEESELNIFLTGAFDADNSYNEGIVSGGLRAGGNPKRQYDFDTYKRGTNTTLMGTFDYKINSNNSVFFNSMFLNSTSQDYSEYRGSDEEFDSPEISSYGTSYGIIQRGTYEQTKLLVNQFVGKHTISDQLKVDWALGYNNLDNVVPDRMQNTFNLTSDGEDFTFFSNSAIHNHRYFQDLNERELSANASLSYSFNDSNEEGIFKGKLTVGYSGRGKSVDYSSELYNFKPEVNFTFGLEDINNVDNQFSIANFDDGKYEINKISQSYEGSQNIHSYYASLKYELTPKLTSIIGVRAESVQQDVSYISIIKPNGDESPSSEFKVLPSLVSKYKINEKQNLKIAFSQTYTLPQFKEKVRIVFEDVAQNYIGNPDLYASTNYNIDLGYELYPNKGELISATTFAKFIQNPINEVFINSASGDISYVNSGDLATAIGLELEFRKNLMKFSDANDKENKVDFGFNGSYIYQNQDLDKDKVSDETELSASFSFDDVELAGASRFLINSDIAYSKEIGEKGSLTSTIAYSYFSDKLAVIGTQERGNLIDKAVGTLDFVTKMKFSNNLKLGVSIKNILNPSYERVLEQSEVEGFSDSEDVVVQSFKRGVGASISLGYTF